MDVGAVRGFVYPVLRKSLFPSAGLAGGAGGGAGKAQHEAHFSVVLNSMGFKGRHPRDIPAPRPARRSMPSWSNLHTHGLSIDPGLKAQPESLAGVQYTVRCARCAVTSSDVMQCNVMRCAALCCALRRQARPRFGSVWVCRAVLLLPVFELQSPVAEQGRAPWGASNLFPEEGYYPWAPRLPLAPLMH